MVDFALPLSYIRGLQMEGMGEEEMENVKNEVHILASLKRHPNIITLLDKYGILRA